MEKRPLYIAIRAALTFLIHWEIRVEKKDCLE